MQTYLHISYILDSNFSESDPELAPDSVAHSAEPIREKTLIVPIACLRCDNTTHVACIDLSPSPRLTVSPMFPLTYVLDILLVADRQYH